MTVGPFFSDPIARQLYAEIASIEEQHVTQYGSIIDPDETWLEKWLMHEACEVYNYYSCVESETNPRIKKIWERFLDYELGHFHYVRELIERFEQRDVSVMFKEGLPEPIRYESHREFVRETLRSEVDLRTIGPRFVDVDDLPADSPSIAYRERMNAEGSPSEIVAAGYIWSPRGELGRVPPVGMDAAGRNRAEATDVEERVS
jgi:hypothetical protein